MRATALGLLACLLVAGWLATVGCREDQPASPVVLRSRPAPAAATTRPAGTPVGQLEVLAEFPLGEPGDCILVPVHLKGKRHIFLLDTGYTRSEFDTTLVPELRPPVRTYKVGTAAGSAEVTPYHRVPDARLGKVCLAPERWAWVGDLATEREVSGHDIRGVVGMAALRRYVLHLDFDGGKGYVLRPDKAKHPEWGVAIPMEFGDEGVPFVFARPEGAPELKFFLDTGHTGEGDLYETFFDRLVREGNLPVQKSFAVTSSGTVRCVAARFGAMSLASLRYKDVVLWRGNRGLLGMGFFSRHVVTMDFANGWLYLRKGKRFDRREGGGRSGLYLVVPRGKIIVSGVEANSPAAEAGLRAGDVVVKFNGADAAKLGKWRIKEELQEPGKVIRFIVEWKGKRREVRFTVAKGI